MIKKTNDALEVEYKQIRAEMAGISPKLSTYQELEKRAAAIKATLGTISSARLKIRKNERGVDRRIKIDPEAFKKIEFKVIVAGMENLNLAPTKKTICNIPGCGAKRKRKSKKQLRAYCTKHWKEHKKVNRLAM